ncbi:MAG: C26 family cysteine hydrolase domain-containing family [Gammaproteobacteria bacterium]|nr:C26 family cysteine hydrolase domain-containing family [Gammaproteobacteria bacterium]
MRKRKILVFQHVPFEPLGTLNPLLKNAGFRIRYVNFGRDPDAQPSLDGYVGLIILGGPMNVHQSDEFPNLPREIKLIQEALDRGMQVLGICLGAQLLARALGASVYPAERKEIGWYPVEMSPQARMDPLLGACDASETLFQWHGDQFELPAGAKRLASSELCDTQAFAWMGQAYGLQFHMEVDEPLIERWLTVPQNVAELATVSDYIDPMAIRHQIPEFLPRMESLSHQVFSNWVAQFEISARRAMLRSR